MIFEERASFCNFIKKIMLVAFNDANGVTVYGPHTPIYFPEYFTILPTSLPPPLSLTLNSNIPISQILRVGTLALF